MARETVRAKVFVRNVTQLAYGGTDGKQHQESVEFDFVYADDPDHENRAFWEATPSGKLEMQITNPGAFGFFGIGQEYYLDFTLAE